MKKQFLLYGSFLCLGLVFGDLEGMNNLPSGDMSGNDFLTASRKVWRSFVDTETKFARCIASLHRNGQVTLTDKGFRGLYSTWAAFTKCPTPVDAMRAKIDAILATPDKGKHAPSPSKVKKRDKHETRHSDSDESDDDSYDGDQWNDYYRFATLCADYTHLVSLMCWNKYFSTYPGYQMSMPIPVYPQYNSLPENSYPSGSTYPSPQMNSASRYSGPSTGFSSGPYNQQMGPGPRYFGQPAGFSSGPYNQQMGSGTAYSFPPAGYSSGTNNPQMGPGTAYSFPPTTYSSGPYNQQMGSGPGYSGPPAGYSSTPLAEVQAYLDQVRTRFGGDIKHPDDLVTEVISILTAEKNRSSERCTPGAFIRELDTRVLIPFSKQMPQTCGSPASLHAYIVNQLQKWYGSGNAITTALQRCL